MNSLLEWNAWDRLFQEEYFSEFVKIDCVTVAFSIIVWRPNKGRTTDCNEIIDVNLECTLNTSTRISYLQICLVF